MRNVVICGLVLGALGLFGCDDKSSGGNAMPSASAMPSAAPPMPSASSKAEKPMKDEKDEKDKKAEGPKDHKARFKAIEEAWGARDAKKISALYAEDAVVKSFGHPDVKGRADLEKDLGKTFGAFKDFAIVPGRVFEKDKKTAVIEWVAKGTSTGDAPDMGIDKATNKPFGVVGASWLEIGDDGFIKEEHKYLDGPTLVGQVKEEKKNPVRAVITTPPDGSATVQSAALLKEEKKAEAKEAEGEKKNQEVEDKFLADMNGKPADAMKLVAEDFKFSDYTQEKDVANKKAYEGFMHSYAVAFPDLKVKSTASFTDGDYVVEELEWSGTQKGALGAIKPTNKSATLHTLEIHQFKDGKLVRGWGFGDNGELLSQLGVTGEKSEKKEKKEKK